LLFMLSSKIKIPERPLTLAQLMLAACARNAGKVAMRYRAGAPWSEVTYRDWETRAVRLAAWLVDRGLKPGERIAILCFNGPAWPIIDFAAYLCGASVVPMYPSLLGPQHNYILHDAAIRFFFVMDRVHLEPIRRLEGALEGVTVVGILPVAEWPKPSREKLKECGLTASPPDWPEGTVTLASILAGGDPDEAKLAELAKRVEATGPDELATICYTSGTTSAPPSNDGTRVYAGKGVMLTHRNLVTNAEATCEAAGLNANDVFLSILPLAHMFERTCGYYCAVHRGATIAYAGSPATFIDDMAEVKPTVFACVPLLFEKMYQRAFAMADKSAIKHVFGFARAVTKPFVGEEGAGRLTDRLKAKVLGRLLRGRTGGRLRFAVSGGAALSKDLAEFLHRDAGILVLEGYGLSETAPVLTFNRPDRFRFGTVGIAAPGIEIKIAADGEVVAKGPNIMKGYLNSPEETAAVLDADGTFHTGDLGAFDPDGMLRITGRKKCMFKLTTGKYVNPEPIENRLVPELVAQSMVCGEGQKVAGVAIFPNMPALRALAEDLGIAGDDAELCRSDKLRQKYRKLVDDACAMLPDYEKVKVMALLPHPLTVDGGELTPTMKVKRGVVSSRFKDEIAAMFTGSRPD
jgi:long-chain acyl-CoA synthetase